VPVAHFTGQLTGRVVTGVRTYWRQESTVTFQSAHQWWFPHTGRYSNVFVILASPEEPFYCDLESWRLAEWHATGLAGLLHDYLYLAGPVSRASADSLYHEALRVLGLDLFRARMRWLAVRTLGWPAWARHRIQDVRR
jgi:hypothetical protein